MKNNAIGGGNTQSSKYNKRHSGASGARGASSHAMRLFLLCLLKWIKDLVVVRFVTDMCAPVILAFAVPLV